MLSRMAVTAILGECLRSLHESGHVEQAIEPTEDTILMGTGTKLDSIAFVTLLTDVEDRLYAEFGREVSIGMDLGDWDDANPFRTVGSLTDHIVRIAGLEPGAPVLGESI